MTVACASARHDAPGDGPAMSNPRFEALDDAGAWNRISRVSPPLPLWARTLAGSLPRTAAAQLDLDHLHRTRNPLGPALAGRIRWAVADENRCAYAKSIAAADLARAGLDEAATRDLGSTASLPADVRIAIDFARRLTRSGASLTDGDVAELVAAVGRDDAVAIVHSVAHANFQDRLFLGLGLTDEPGGPLPPRAAGDGAELAAAAPPRREPSEDVADAPFRGPDATWEKLGLDELRALLDAQTRRAPRIPLPDEPRLARLPRPTRRLVASPTGSSWGKISLGYQPELTDAWYRAMRSFDAEAQLDLAFANTLFWVVTRTNDCFY
jgi:hypothetical protein